MGGKTDAPFEGEPPAVASTTPTAAPVDGEQGHGRIGYGRYARFTPLLLAGLLISALGAIGWAQRDRAPAIPSPALLVGEPAPDVTLPLLDGGALRLADLRGSTVVLNFWASWCRPCRNEAPLLQALHDEAQAAGQPLAVAGVGARLDRTADAVAFVRDLGLTYPVGRDTVRSETGSGQIERAFSVSLYPSTIFVRPDGIVDSVVVGEMTVEQLRTAVAGAHRGDD